MDHDRVMCALLIKLRRTTESVRTLCVGGFGEDAKALARVALENALVMAWLVEGTARDRLDTYQLASAPTVLHWREVILTHYADDPDTIEAALGLVDTDAATVAAQIFNDSHTNWAMFPNAKGKPTGVSIKEMFEEVAGGIAFVRDAAYFDCSAYIHSHPHSLEMILASLRGEQFFTLSGGPAEGTLTAVAMGIALVSLLWGLSVLNRYAALDLDTDLEGIKASLVGL